MTITPTIALGIVDAASILTTQVETTSAMNICPTVVQLATIAQLAVSKIKSAAILQHYKQEGYFIGFPPALFSPSTRNPSPICMHPC